MKLKTFLILLLLVLIISFRLLCGIFVAKPIAALTEGTTIIYWRAGLEMPFISSVDGILTNKDSKKGLPGRAMQAGELLSEIKDRKILKFGYSETIYRLSVDEGK